MHKNKKIHLGALSFLAIAICGWVDGWSFSLIQTVAAQTTTPTSNIFSSTAEVAVTIAQAMEVMAFIVFHFLEYFLDPFFIMSITDSQGLHNIWSYSRDIMNVIFAFMLIAVGILTVINYELGKNVLNDKFKKFILAVILVNFSWFFPRLILDVANVLTATIYQLPAGLSSSGTTQCWEKPPDPDATPPFAGKPCKVVDDVKFFKACDEDALEAEEGAVEAAKYINKDVVCWKTIDWDSSTNTSYGIINGLVYNYGKLGQLTRVLNPSRGPDIDDERYIEYMMFVIHILFVLTLMAMLFLPLAAMFVAFLIRIPIMWVTIAFMPFMFIGYLAEDKFTPGFNSFEIFKHYVKAAFLPAAVAVPFAIGFILVAEISNFKCPGVAGTLCNKSGPFIHGVDTMWQLMMMMIAFIIIWFGFWSAMKIDSIYENTTQGIRSFGSSVGKTALKLPLSVPFIPTGKGKDNMSILGIDDAMRRFESGLSAGKSPFSRGGKSAGGAGAGAGAVVDTLNDSNAPMNKALNNIAQSLRGRDGSIEATNFENTIGVELQNENSELSKAVKKDLNGRDPSKMTVSEVMSAVRSSSESSMMKIIADIKKATDSSSTT